MSFKRAGDDHCALRLQKKRRVTDLLGEDIPSDEATQTRSGRFVCLVCPHNPVLDTMAMLVIHRQGRRHLSNVAIKVEKEHDLCELLQKKEQERYLKEATSATSCSQKDRNYTVVEKNMETGPLLARTRQLTEAIQKQGKNITARNQLFKDDLLPLDISKKSKPFFQSRVQIPLTKKLEEKSSELVQQGTCTSTYVPETLSCSRSKKIVAKETRIVDRGVAKGTVAKMGQTANRLDASKLESVNSKGKKKRELTEEQQRYLELKMAGWILDHSGNWIKDDNVEFDSDEDEPPLSLLEQN